MRDRLIKLIAEVQYMGGLEEKLADHLINNGVLAVDFGVVSPRNRPLISQCFGRPLDEVLDLFRTKQEWISVEDRLPDSGVHCILCCDMKRIDGTHSQYVCDGYLAERFKINAHYADDDCATEYNEEDDEYYLKEGWYEVIKNWDNYNSIVIDDTVTHWMPLPEPPMKGGAE